MQLFISLRRVAGRMCVLFGVCFVVISAASFPALAATPNDNWATPLATKLGARLEAQFDSSGPDAWDTKASTGVHHQRGAGIRWPAERREISGCRDL